MPAKLEIKIQRIKKFFFGCFMESKKKALTSFAKDKMTIMAVRATIVERSKPIIARKW